MFILSLFACVALGAFSAQAKVVTSFDECKEFFYKGKEPSGIDQNAERICQKLQYGGFYYATLYSVHHRIPLYSAYTFDPACLTSTGRTKSWCIEPQISKPSSNIDYMVHERQSGVNIEDIKRCQAINRHYRNTTYDRGHLNPNSFQCGDGRKATFTLTNAVPMNRNFNQGQWNKCESTLRSFLIDKLASDYGLATVYIVTGVVPDGNVRIPQRDISEDPEQVTVPSHIWTAVCYKHLIFKNKYFSFGYIGQNQAAQPDIRIITVSELNDQLSRLYSQLSESDQSIRVFVDDCSHDNKKLNLVYKNLIKVLVECMVDHHCAPNGYCNYWYSKAKIGNYCRSNHAYAEYGLNSRWCYMDDQNNYGQSCISEDCYLPVTEKKSQPDPRCGNQRRHAHSN